MKSRRYSIEQVVEVLKQHELGAPVADIAASRSCRADVLPVQEAVWRFAARQGSGAQAVARGEHRAQAAGKPI